MNDEVKELQERVRERDTAIRYLEDRIKDLRNLNNKISESNIQKTQEILGLRNGTHTTYADLSALHKDAVKIIGQQKSEIERLNFLHRMDHSLARQVYRARKGNRKSSRSGALMICPNCKNDLTGEPIPEKDREAFGGHTHFGRQIGIYSRKLDRTMLWKCPDCGHTWGREDGEGD